ncbi:MAG: hypothetical protein ABR549_15840 [Mycobacteriales bacterium]
MRRLALALLVLLLWAATPASADDPVLSPEARSDLVEALQDASTAQGICYGYTLQVDDDDGDAWDGAWTVSNLGLEVDPTGDPRCQQSVVLHAWIYYPSDWSDSEDSSDWTIQSTLGGPTTDELGRLGLHAGDLLDDGKADTTLFNAVLALPMLVADAGFAEPVKEPADESMGPPADARATDRPGSDWWREKGTTLLVLLGGIVLAGLLASTTTPTGHRRARAVWRVLKD